MHLLVVMAASDGKTLAKSASIIGKTRNTALCGLLIGKKLLGNNFKFVISQY
jgi:hypothetical protein